MDAEQPELAELETNPTGTEAALQLKEISSCVYSYRDWGCFVR